MTDAELQTLARRRVGLKFGFAIHLLVYTLVNAGLLVLSLSQGGRWHWGPLLGWGLGLTIHGLVTLLSLRGQGLRARMVAAELEQLRQRQQVPVGASKQAQSSGIGEVANAVIQLDQMPQLNVALAQESAAAAQRIAQPSERLAQTVSTFKL